MTYLSVRKFSISTPLGLKESCPSLASDIPLPVVSDTYVTEKVISSNDDRTNLETGHEPHDEDSLNKANAEQFQKVNNRIDTLEEGVKSLILNIASLVKSIEEKTSKSEAVTDNSKALTQELREARKVIEGLNKELQKEKGVGDYMRSEIANEQAYRSKEKYIYEATANELSYVKMEL